MTAYYNEIDPHAAQWLRNLIYAGHIASGIVDERSIEDVFPSDLRGFTQCHFFSGVGVWSHALRQAGWSDDRPVWTGSCPCQPFSAAGKGAGFDDERHLWPAFHHLIKECKPAIVIGEQVASKDADPWIDLVHTDLEALGYAFGAIPFPSAGVGGPHIRDRLYWVADTERKQRQKCVSRPAQSDCTKGGRQTIKLARLCSASGVADYDSDGCQPGREGRQAMGHGQAPGADCGAGRLEHPRQDHDASQIEAASHGQSKANGPANQLGGSGVSSGTGTGPTNGFWRAADWLLCRDGKWRPVEPGTFPLAHGAPSRVVRLRAYGNAINAKAAQAFIECLIGD